jgi:hypothetical protein
MAAKTKGGMWCNYCRRPTLGVKNTHRLRNTGAVGSTVMTGGLSLLFAKNESYVCQMCGGPVEKARELALKCPYCKASNKLRGGTGAQFTCRGCNASLVVT